MAGTRPFKTARGARWAGFHARLAAFSRAPQGFAAEPEPRTVGTLARGRQLVEGKLLLAGHQIDAPGTLIWDVAAPSQAFARALHGAAWLDDLAALGDAAARDLAQEWVFAWIDRYGRGKGAGWAPELVARRLIRWINNASLLTQGLDELGRRRYFRALGQQTVYLSRRWRQAEAGLARIEALTGLIIAALALAGLQHRAEPAIEALAAECARDIDADGAIPSRNPEELLQVLTLVTWAAEALAGAGRAVPEAIAGALARMVPVLRALRHADGGLARFHGGGRGAAGRLDQALAASGIRTPPGEGLAMGFARLAVGRTSVIVDAAAPPMGAPAREAHASTLAFELTSGRRPLVVNCGAGVAFGERWRRAGRATPSHSAICIDGVSSSRLAPLGGAELLTEGPRDVLAVRAREKGQERLTASHDGWSKTHGLICYRTLTLSADGRALSGNDMLAAGSYEEKRRYHFAIGGTPFGGIPYSVRFHLHPDVAPEYSQNTDTVTLRLRSGEVWAFGYEGAAELTIEPSVYLEQDRIEPRATKQIVLSGRVIDYAARVSWTLAKTVDTPSHLRDVEMAEPVLIL